MNSLFSLQGKVAVVTGGYGHLGKSITLALESAGAIVIVAGRDIKKFNKVFKDKKNIHFEYLDLKNNESIESAYQNVFEKFASLDILINNGFYGEQCMPESKNIKGWEMGIDGGLNSVYKSIEYAIPFLKNSDNAKIVNIASMYGMQIPDFSMYSDYKQFFNPPNYGTAKAGVIHLTKYYAKYLAQYAILVNSISPGPFPSVFVQKEKGFIEEIEKRSPLGRIGKPDEIMGVIIFLSSAASSYVTGQNIAVDGGWTI